MSKISKYSFSHNLHVNTSKSNYLIFCNYSIKDNIRLILKISDKIIQTVDELKNLGLTINIKFRFKRHINDLLKSTYAIIP